MAYRDREKSDITILEIEAGDYVTVPLVFKFLPCDTCSKCSGTGTVERKPTSTLIDWDSRIKGAYLKAVSQSPAFTWTRGGDHNKRLLFYSS